MICSACGTLCVLMLGVALLTGADSYGDTSPTAIECTTQGCEDGCVTNGGNCGTQCDTTCACRILNGVHQCHD